MTPDVETGGDCGKCSVERMPGHAYSLHHSRSTLNVRQRNAPVVPIHVQGNQ